MSAIVHLVLLYGAPSCEEPTKHVPSYAAKINKVRRRILARSVCSYRKVSNEALNILPSTSLVDLLILERSRKFSLRRHPGGNASVATIRANWQIMASWKERLERASFGQWTLKLISNLEGWCIRSFESMDFHLTQVISGNGCFGEYLFMIKKEPSSGSMQCGTDHDGVRHISFECANWVSVAQYLEITPELNVGRKQYGVVNA